MAASTSNRINRGQVNQIVKILGPILLNHCFDFYIVGSYRRGNNILGDLDFLLVDGNLPTLIDSFPVSKVTVLRCGKSIASVLMWFQGKEIQIEFVSTTRKTLGAALLHTTGGAEFNMELRTYAKQKGWLLNQYGLFKGGRPSSRTEEGIFAALGLHFIPPDVRCDGFWDVVDLYEK